MKQLAAKDRSVKRRTVSGILGLLFLLSTWALGVEPKFVPPDGKILFCAGQNRESVDDYVATVGIVPAGIMSYTSIQYMDSLSEPQDFGAGTSHAQYTLEKYPNTFWQVGLYMVDALENVLAGQYDDNLDTLAEFIRKMNRPVFLRIGYEFDGPHNHYEPELYVKAFRYIVDRFRKKNINNVAYVWHSYASVINRPLTDWYPGDDYVDWFGISYFNQPEKLMEPMLALAAEHKKPMMVAEASPAGIGTSSGEKAWDRWFAGYFDFVNRKGIKMFCYINIDWDAFTLFKDLNWGDCTLGRNKLIVKNWKAEISKKQYLMASPNLYKQMGFATGKKSQ